MWILSNEAFIYIYLLLVLFGEEGLLSATQLLLTLEE